MRDCIFKLSFSPVQTAQRKQTHTHTATLVVDTQVNVLSHAHHVALFAFSDIPESTVGWERHRAAWSAVKP